MPANTTISPCRACSEAQTQLVKVHNTTVQILPWRILFSDEPICILRYTSGCKPRQSPGKENGVKSKFFNRPVRAATLRNAEVFFSLRRDRTLLPDWRRESA